MNITVNSADMKIENGKLIINIDSEIEKLLSKEKMIRLCDVKIGSIINGKYVVVEQDLFNKRTAVVRKGVIDKRIAFGKSNNWKESDLRKYLNKEYYEELCEEFGRESIENHMVDLLSMDGSDEYGSDVCFVSAMTFDRYREYHKLIGNAKCVEWLSTPNQTKDDGDTTYVRCVGGDGFVRCDDCDWFGGAVRPFFVLDSNIFVSLD